MKTVRARVNSLTALDTTAITDPTVLLRLQLIDHRVAMLHDVLEQDKIAAAELAALVAQTKSTLTDLVGIAPRAAAEILVETGDIRRFTEAGFARFNGTAPDPRHLRRRRAANPSDIASHAAATVASTPPSTAIAMIQLRYETRARTPSRPRPRQRPHPPRSHAHPQAPPLRRDLPDHAPRRPTTTPLDMRASNAAPTSSGSSPTTPPRSVSSAPSSPTSTTSGPSPAATSRSPPWPPSSPHATLTALSPSSSRPPTEPPRNASTRTPPLRGTHTLPSPSPPEVRSSAPDEACGYLEPGLHGFVWVALAEPCRRNPGSCQDSHGSRAPPT